MATDNEPRSQRRTERSIRSLENLQASASSSRALNLIAVGKKYGGDEDYRTQPFFRSATLNRSIIVKHRLRSDERYTFPGARSEATKVILPLHIDDLRLGARSFFVGQAGYDRILTELLGESGRLLEHDSAMLEVIDALPSLDPFLMRERLKQNGFNPARCYFAISEADTARMFEFALQEVAPLVGISFGETDVANGKAAQLASKILNEAGGDELEPLRMGMGMDRAAFDEGIFCWKGFIYYKWMLMDLLPRIPAVSAELGTVRPTGPVTGDQGHFIIATRARLSRAMSEACETVRLTLNIYDDAYRDLTRNGQPLAFREFLLRAPNLFHELGERLGSVQHIISFWRYRFPDHAGGNISAEELVELLADFAASLTFARLENAA